MKKIWDKVSLIDPSGLSIKEVVFQYGEVVLIDRLVHQCVWAGEKFKDRPFMELILGG